MSGLDLGPRSYSKLTCAPNSIFRRNTISYTLFVNNVTDKGLISKIHKQLMQHDNKKQRTQPINEQKT